MRLVLALTGVFFLTNQLNVGALETTEWLQTDECQARAQSVIGATTAQFVRISSGIPRVVLFHPFVGEFSLYCDPGRLSRLEFFSSNTLLDFRWYAVVTLAAEAIGLNQSAVEETAKTCFERADAETGDEESLDQSNLRVVCAKYYDAELPFSLLHIGNFTEEGRAFYD